MSTTTTPFDIEFDIYNIPTIFATCISLITHILAGVTNEEEALRLSIVRVRLTRWGDAVGVYSDPNLGEPEPHPEDLEQVKNTLIHLISRFEAISTTAFKQPERHTNEQIVAKPCCLRRGLRKLAKKAHIYNNDKVDPRALSIQQLLISLDEIACKRSDPHQHLGLLNDRVLSLTEHTECLVQVGDSCADDLEKVFPASQRVEKLAFEEKSGMEDDHIIILQEAAMFLDPWICLDVVATFTSTFAVLIFHIASDSAVIDMTACS